MSLAILMTVAAVPTPSLNEVVWDPRTYVYDNTTVRQLSDSEGLLYPVDYHFAPRRDKTGNPNNEKPWKVNGGLDIVDHYGKRYLWLPPGTKITLFRRRVWGRAGRGSRVIFTRNYGRFPDGSFVAEFLYDGAGRLFEVRSRRKLDGKWNQDEHLFFGSRPAGYQAIQNCADCHSDIGKHADQLDPRREWYSSVRGLERGGPIAFHPWEWRAAYGRPGQRPVIRDDVKHLVEWE